MILLGIGAVMHPVLEGTPEAQLRMISAMSFWRPMHLLMLAGSGLLIAGVWLRVVGDNTAATTFNGPLIAAMALISLGLAINALNIGFMAGAGTHMAEEFTAGRTEMATLFHVTHPIGLIAARIGNLIVALGALALGFVESRDANRPRWVAWLAYAAGVGGIIGVVFFDEASRLALAAVALLSGWQLATALLSFRAKAR
jgi:hypothetical protein